MVRIGFIGTQSKHFTFFGELLNKTKCLEGYSLTGVYSCDEDEQTAREKTDELGACYYTNVYELIASSDLVMIITRKAEPHEKYGMMALNAGKNVFLDKPVASSVKILEQLCSIAQGNNLILFGGSSLVWLDEFKKLRNELNYEENIIIRYFGDAQSEFDGFRFYGSHLAQVVIAIFGEGYDEVAANFKGNEAIVSLKYPGRSVHLEMSPEYKDLPMTFITSERKLYLPETGCYQSILTALKNSDDAQQKELLKQLAASVSLTEQIIQKANHV